MKESSLLERADGLENKRIRCPFVDAGHAFSGQMVIMGVFSYLSSCEGLTSLQKIGESMVESFRKEEEVTRAIRYRSETRSKLRRLPDKFLER